MKNQTKVMQVVNEISDFDPFVDLKGDDKKVFDAVSRLCDSLYNYEFFERSCTRRRIDPIITSIIDQNSGGGRHNFKNDKRFFIFVNNFCGKGYIEIETGLEIEENLFPFGTESSSHGIPASYGKEIYHYDRLTGRLTFDRMYFKMILKERREV